MSDQGRLSFIQAQDGTLVIRLVGVPQVRNSIGDGCSRSGCINGELETGCF
jgi:hypothetical protein